MASNCGYEINPLDVDFDQEWESADDPRIELEAGDPALRHHMSVAHFDWLCWCRRRAQLRVVPEAPGKPARAKPGGPAD